MERAEEERTDNDEDEGERTSKSIRDMIEQQEESDNTSISVFSNPELVDPNTIIDAGRIVGRDEQLNEIIAHLRPSLTGQRPPNMLLYGPSGTGKSLIINAVGEQIRELCENNGIDFGIISLNCQMVDSLDRAAYELVVSVAEAVGVDPDVPPTGISAKDKLDRLFEIVNNHYEVVLFVLDEIDYLEKAQQRGEPAYSKLLYQLSRAGVSDRIEGQCSVAALTNDPQFMENLDGRADSSFNPEDVHFPDYDANQLREILHHRSDAYRTGCLNSDVIPLTAAYAAQSHGDARKAIDLFRKAGKLADKNGSDEVTEEHVREAQEEIDVDRTRKLIKGLSTQKKIGFFSTAAVSEHSDLDSVPSPIGYKLYCWITETIDADQMTRETYVKYMKELEGYGLIQCTRRGRGKGKGMHMEFDLCKPTGAVIDALDDGRLRDVSEEEITAVVSAQVQQFFDH